MMKHSKRVLAMITALVMLACSFAFAGGALIVTPAQNSIIYTDTLLVSVKLTEKQSVNITVFEEQDKVEITEIKDPAATNILKEDDKIYELVSVDASSFTVEDLGLIAAGVTKDEKGNDILLSSGGAIKTYVDTVFGEKATCTNTKSATIYTKQLSGFKPGLYKVQVDVLDNEGKVAETIFNLVAVKRPEDEPKEDPLNDAQGGKIKTVIQNIIDAIFK